ncbi:LacI family transcriptional regulator [Demequina sp. TTPB684]|uniref:LacI family DNA-binding transcriptional regulator n=1 Tax=unclassified Demequina TaxID=2620311 RepID=UPI001CF4BBA7|nr:MULTISPECIES: LacI family DNA-binding transcriptional regulator [unclassified Demequina]MCB2413972.1 LacI family transcriptional regulator [Demequina sp. TTPB684]UPU88674.1 LacI family transcriptional regulator [Demequina sp. TMPB413]
MRSPELPPAPTLEMVGALAGVSRATVSRVVNGSPRVSEEVVQAVRAAIVELGYVPNRAARSLASKQAHAIALVVPEDMSRLFGDLYLASIIGGIHNRLEQSDYVLNLMVASERGDGKTMRYLQGGNVDGAIVISHHTDDTFLSTLTQTLPVVFGGRPAVRVQGGHVVDVDNVAGSRTATEHLISTGRTRIATITGPQTMPGGIDRLTGFLATLEEAGLAPGPIVEGDFTLRSGTEAMRQVLEQDATIDGIFVASDMMAAGAMTVLRSQGRTVPDDVAVVGYDDSAAALTTDVPLTTVRQPSESMGVTIASILMDVLNGIEDHPRLTLLPTELVVRSSA